MTGRRLYEIITGEIAKRADSIVRANDWKDTKHSTTGFVLEQIVLGVEDAEPYPVALPAFDFLPEREKEAWSAAAKRLSGRRS